MLRDPSPNTVRAYTSDVRDFADWCAEQRVALLPASPETVLLYITDLAQRGAKASTIQRRLPAISHAHELAGHVPSPTTDPLVRTAMAGIRRSLGTAPVQKTAMVTAELRMLVAVTPAHTLAGRRDRALLLLGFAGGLRRSELVALDMEDVRETMDGLRVRLRHSRSAQDGEADEVRIPIAQHPDTCPMRALRAWRCAAGITTGALFRAVNRHDQLASERLSDGSVARIVQRAARRAGLDPSRYASQSLRRGLATAAAQCGAPARAIMRRGRWTSVAVAHRYIRAAAVAQEKALASCGR